MYPPHSIEIFARKKLPIFINELHFYTTSPEKSTSKEVLFSVKSALAEEISPAEIVALEK